MLTEQARKKYQDHELYWSANLMVELENKRQGTTLVWAIECMKALVENVASPAQEQLMSWLAELSALSKSGADGSTLIERGQQIWHAQRDLLHTATAHLYAALAYLSQQDISWYRRSLVSAMDVMGEHEFYRQTAAAIPLALFEKFLESPGHGEQ